MSFPPLEADSFELSAEGVVPPVQRAVVPVQRAVLPVRRATSPVKGTVLSVQRAVLPAQRAALPVKGAILPGQRAVLPVRRTVLPVECTAAVTAASIVDRVCTNVDPLCTCSRQPVASEGQSRPQTRELANADAAVEDKGFSSIWAPCVS